MASIQRISSAGWRIYWKLYFPNGTNKEKYKTSKSKDKLEKMLPEIARIETLSQRNDLIPKDLVIAHNLRLISRKEVLSFKWAAERGKSKLKREDIFKDLNNQLCSVTNDIFKIKEKLERYSEPDEYLNEDAIALGEHVKNEWVRWKKRFLPSEYPDPPPGIIRPTTMGIGVPSTSGIYFVWENGDVVYIGQSINMSDRVRLKHDSILANDLLSFVPMGKDELDWAECYYIGILKPKRNFQNNPQDRNRIDLSLPIATLSVSLCH